MKYAGAFIITISIAMLVQLFVVIDGGDSEQTTRILALAALFLAAQSWMRTQDDEEPHP